MVLRTLHVRHLVLFVLALFMVSPRAYASDGRTDPAGGAHLTLESGFRGAAPVTLRVLAGTAYALDRPQNPNAFVSQLRLLHQVSASWGIFMHAQVESPWRRLSGAPNNDVAVGAGHSWLVLDGYLVSLSGAFGARPSRTNPSLSSDSVAVASASLSARGFANAQWTVSALAERNQNAVAPLFLGALAVPLGSLMIAAESSARLRDGAAYVSPMLGLGTSFSSQTSAHLTATWLDAGRQNSRLMGQVVITGRLGMDDGDGLRAAEDLCPSAAGEPEHLGCPFDDRDGDGVWDRLDACPDASGDALHAGCPSENA